MSLTWRSRAQLRQLVEFDHTLHRLDVQILTERIDMLEQALAEHLNNHNNQKEPT